MTSWAYVASKGLDFLKAPSGLAVFLICFVLVILLLSAPMVIYYDGIHQLQATQKEDTAELKAAILSLKDSTISNK